MIIPLAHWSDSVECVWWLDESYHTSMKLTTLEMAFASMLVVRKVIVRVKKGMYDIYLLSHINDNDFKEMSLFDVRRSSVRKETYLSTIYNISHLCPDNIRGDVSLDGNDQGVSYSSDDTIINDYNFEEMEKQSHHLSLKRSMSMNKIRYTG